MAKRSVSMERAKDLTKDYALFSPKGGAEVWRAKDFWAMAFDKSHRKNTKDMGYLVSSYDFDCDWASWEKHPHGDEFVCCLAGEMTFLMETKGRVRRVKVKAGQFIIVPKNTWHTAHVRKPAKALFVTWGHGTQHRPA